MLGYTKEDNEKMVDRLSKFGVGAEVRERLLAGCTLHSTTFSLF